MKPLIAVLIAVAIGTTAGCSPPPSPAPVARVQYEPPLPPVTYCDVPVALRQLNYGPSCAHASLIVVLRMQGHYRMARWWRQTYYGGEQSWQLAERVERAGLRFAYTNTGNERFLDWCAETRRCAVIWYYTRHAVTFAGYRNGQAVIIDNRWPERDVLIPKDVFVQNWKNFGGFALTVVYTPPPPPLVF